MIPEIFAEQPIRVAEPPRLTYSQDSHLKAIEQVCADLDADRITAATGQFAIDVLRFLLQIDHRTQGKIISRSVRKRQREIRQMISEIYCGNLEAGPARTRFQARATVLSILADQLEDEVETWSAEDQAQVDEIVKNFE